MIGMRLPKINASPNSIPPLVGWDMPGGELPDGDTPSSGTNYLFPVAADINYAYSKGINFMCFNFCWYALQPTLGGAFNGTYQSNFTTAVNHALSLGIWVSIRCAPVIAGSGPYVGYSGKCIGQSGGPTNANFANLWSQLTSLFKDNSRIIFDLGNEPNCDQTASQTTALWYSACNAAIVAIRTTGGVMPIFVEGMGYAAAVDWGDGSYYDRNGAGTSNATGWLTLTDSINNIYPCVHDYWDGSTGDSGDNTDISLNASPTVGNNNTGVLHLTTTNETGSAGTGVLAWAQTNNKRIFIGEMHADTTCTIGTPTTAISNYQNEIGSNLKNIIGLAWWAMGSSFYSSYSPGGLYPSTPYTVNNVNYALFSPLLALLVT